MKKILLLLIILGLFIAKNHNNVNAYSKDNNSKNIVELELYYPPDVPREEYDERTIMINEYPQEETKYILPEDIYAPGVKESIIYREDEIIIKFENSEQFLSKKDNSITIYAFEKEKDLIMITENAMFKETIRKNNCKEIKIPITDKKIYSIHIDASEFGEDEPSLCALNIWFEQ